MLIPPNRRRSFQRRVLTWYAANGRDLPWRKTRDPYAILISEILSHQTQISRVVPVYHRLLDRYPTVQAMARAEPPDIKAITDPLGYKIRGRWLHAAALAVAEHGGRFPRTVEGLRRLPGIGRYTAGAVMNFAHQLDTPMVDTNIARVLGRHFGGIGLSTDRAAVWRAAREIIPKTRGDLINQALMDLGAMICRSRSPRCDLCPLRRSCAYRAAAIARASARPGRRPPRRRGTRARSA